MRARSSLAACSARAALLAWLAAAAAAQAPLQFTALRGGHFPVDTGSATDVAAGDVDGDGDADVVLASERLCTLYLNDGFAVFGAGPALPASAATCLSLVDVDADGDPDLVLGRARGIAGVQNALFLNDGGGRFRDVTSTHMPATADVTLAVATADVDRDGDADLVFGNDSANRLYLNDGTGRFAQAQASRFPPGSAATAAIALGDVDGDGDLDCVAGNLRGPDDLYLNDGSGAFVDATAGRLPGVSSWTRALAFADVDRDGDLDLLAGDDGQPVRALRNDGSGRFTDVTASTMPVGALSTRDLRAVDVDGDGDTDLLIASGNGGNALYLGDGGGRFTAAAAGQLPVDGQWAVALEALDFDGDRRVDVVFASYGCGVGQTQLHLNDGSGRFTAASAGALPGECGETYALAPLSDLDGDGDLDAVVGNEGLNLLLRNDGEGRFTADHTALPPHRDTTYAIAVGDVDGDGDLDLLIGNAGGPTHLYANDGRARFADVTSRLPASQGNASSVLLVDVDGDRDPDAVLGERGGQLRLFTNDGSGAFADATAGRVPVASTATAGLVAVDVDRDGDLDLVLANHAERCRLYLNDGTGRFTDRTTTHLPAVQAPTEAIAAADVDGDGDPDLIVANFGPAQLFVNDGSGRFADATAGRLPATNTSAYAVVATDLDGDRDVDLVVDRRMFVNDGSGRFQDVTAARLPALDGASAIEAGDVDGDGDADLWFGSIPNALLANRLRQIDTPLVARRGAPFTFEVAVEPGFATADRAVIAWLALSRLSPSLQVPPYGWLGVDPVTAAWLPLSIVPRATGATQLALTIPAGVPIQGLTLYWQALVAHGASPADARLTGVIGDTIIH